MQRPHPARTGAVNSLQELTIDPPGDGLRFADRHDAGRRLAPLLAAFRDEHPVVVGMARGGVPVAAEVADALRAPMDVVLVRKIGAPHQPEYAVGALAEGGIRVLDDAAVRATGIGAAELQAVIDREQRELDARLARYRGDTPPLDVRGRTVLLVDDGLATGRSARAAALSLRARGAARIVLAVPVAAPSSLRGLLDCVDDTVCVQAPADLWAVGLWYHDFRPTSDQEVTALLDAHRPSTRPVEREVAVDAGLHLLLPGDLTLPHAPRGSSPLRTARAPAAGARATAPWRPP
nr:phosphoribosyltransferase family protein [Baekduia soli]